MNKTLTQINYELIKKNNKIYSLNLLSFEIAKIKIKNQVKLDYGIETKTVQKPDKLENLIRTQLKDMIKTRIFENSITQ